MSLRFNTSNFTAYPKGSSKSRLLGEQHSILNEKRTAGDSGKYGMKQAFANVGRTPADAYREMDGETLHEVIPSGHLSTLSRVLVTNKPVSLGREVFEYRKSSRAGNITSSMDGLSSVVIDSTAYEYAGTVVPIHQNGFGRSFRVKASMDEEMFDALADDSAETERTIMEGVEKYFWEGNEELSVKGSFWGGIKGDGSVIQSTLSVDITDESVSSKDIRDEIKRQRNILKITNKCSAALTLSVSQEAYSRFEDEYDSSNSSNVTLYDMIKKLGFKEIVEDPYLVGNQLSILNISMQGVCSVIGMPMSVYPVERLRHNDGFNFIRWCAIGFLAKVTSEGNKNALFAA